MSKKLILSSLVALFVFISSPNTSHAQIVTFDLPSTNGPFDFGDDVGQFIDPVTGLVADFAAFVDGSSGEFNATAGNFGINAEGTGDETDELDGDLGAESFTITFSGPVSATLTEVDIVGFAGGDAGTLDIGGTQTLIASGNTTAIPTHTELVGNTLTIAYTGTGTGFSVNSLTFNVVSVPEPSSLALLSLVGLGFAGRRRRR